MDNKKTPKSTSSLNIWLSYLESLHSKTIDMGIERVSKVAIRLNVLKPAPFVFTVTGTNGKGTTCSVLESILIAEGYKVGVYSSPHLINYTERVRIQNNILPEYVHTESFAEIEAVRKDVSLTYFEYSTLSALWLFNQAKLDIAILEVGLGGRLDATNIVDSDVAILTNTALDHTDWLGTDRSSIGYEKAGIFRTSKPAVVGELNTPETVIQVAKRKKAKLLLRNVDWNFIVTKDVWHYNDKYTELINLPIPPYVPQDNAAIAIAALQASSLKISKKAIFEGIHKAFLPGRFQIVSKLPSIILDVAHNPHAAIYLAKRLSSIKKVGNILAIVGMLSSKDIKGTVECMVSIVDSWYCASLQEKQGANARLLTKYLGKGKDYESVAQAWNAAMSDANSEDIVLVYGSFHTVSSVMKLISNK